MSKSIAVILAGSGVYDGSEIHEAVCTLIHLQKAGCITQCFAPDIDQMHVINHLTGEEMSGSRNVLVESARIARGQVQDIKLANVEDFDALIMPGGFGVAKNLSNFAVAGADCEVNADVLALCQAFHKENKVMGLMCIAPVLSARIFGEGVFCTIGNDQNTVQAIEKMGAQHQNCQVNEICVDETNKLITTPCYMLADNIVEVFDATEKLVNAVLERL